MKNIEIEITMLKIYKVVEENRREKKGKLNIKNASRNYRIYMNIMKLIGYNNEKNQS